MTKAALLRPATRLSAFYAAIFLVAGIQLPFWPSGSPPEASARMR